MGSFSVTKLNSRTSIMDKFVTRLFNFDMLVIVANIPYINSLSAGGFSVVQWCIFRVCIRMDSIAEDRYMGTNLGYVCSKYPFKRVLCCAETCVLHI